VKPISEFYRCFGRSLVRSLSEVIIGPWKSPDCRLELVRDGALIVAKGSYEVQGLEGLAFAIFRQTTDPPKARPVPERYSLEYHGSIRGRTIVGKVLRNREGPIANNIGLLSSAEANPTVLMWLADSGDKLHVLERAANTSPRFYAIERA
jgi:hypothetical protein